MLDSYVMNTCLLRNAVPRWSSNCFCILFSRVIQFKHTVRIRNLFVCFLLWEREVVVELGDGMKRVKEVRATERIQVKSGKTKTIIKSNRILHFWNRNQMPFFWVMSKWTCANPIKLLCNCMYACKGIYTICMRCDAMLCMVVRENEKSVKEKKGNVKADGRADIACECERKREREIDT